MLFGGTFYVGLLKILSQNFLFYTERLFYRSSFCVLFWGKKSKWTNSYQKHTHKILLMQLNLLLGIICEKNGMEKLQQGAFFKTNVPFLSFLPFILRYVKKCTQFSECYCYYIPYMKRQCDGEMWNFWTIDGGTLLLENKLVCFKSCHLFKLIWWNFVYASSFTFAFW